MKGRRRKSKRNSRTKTAAIKLLRPARKSFTETVPTQSFQIPTTRPRRNHLLTLAIRRENINSKHEGKQ